ncbi:hypothetical protein [Burkholderia sp. Ac-20379]|uniref:hypothetical protein n=1 Tax=Burkholderia sp. Ac-20379 TaxID=2703900 RepID=UPI001981603F|nr:hypothetical protein [Burkholderia sp. Ac-20379]MBN3728806.1 hypothetical protein [Burkholderia sp. Ac-20379]
MALEDINRIWVPVYGHPAWSVKQGHGSFLAFEFGSPSLRIREPASASPHASERVKASMARRRVQVVGNWHLWIYCCHWVISFHGKEMAHSESPNTMIGLAVELLDGQKLVSAARGAEQGSWLFTFDLGGALRTWSYGEDPTDEQWLLYERESGRVLTVRSDDHYAYSREDERPENTRWLPI